MKYVRPTTPIKWQVSFC